MKENNPGYPKSDELDNQYDRQDYNQDLDDEFEAQDLNDVDYDWENDYTDENEL